MDLMMPAMSGVEALRRLRRSHRWAQLPVVVMTGVNDPMLPVRLDVPVVSKAEIDPVLKAVRHIIGLSQ
jgi:CheY-like chemotaxis protein